MFNAFNDSGDFKVMLTTGSGEITPCAQDEFETDDLSFMGVSNRSKVTVGRFVHVPVHLPPSLLSSATDANAGKEPLGDINS